MEPFGLPSGQPGLPQGPRPKRRAVSSQHRGPRSEAQATIASCPMPRTKGRGPYTPAVGRGVAGNVAVRRGYLSFSLPSHGRWPTPIPPKLAPLRSEHGPWLLEWRLLSLVILFEVWGAHGPRSTVLGPMCGGRGAGIEDRGAWLVSVPHNRFRLAFSGRSDSLEQNQHANHN